MTPSLGEVLQYQNEQVLAHFRNKHSDYSVQSSQQLFQDLLAWMWLAQQRNILGKKSYLFGPLLIVDDMWHSFILHTRDYVQFSTTYFGDYFHHEVEPDGMEHVLDEDEIRDFLEDCYQYLGEGWVERRFSEALV
ncbi:hypothetical protein [Legionella waltersii]|uniref:Uncharacterized protein n=1 Tax=Legionella waltersii TaxID=66969 RepID=A0A0W1ACX5_9GAMM|nr:hypothetical protein [Legionella waltersii]KTD79194.1 hypothetical protein Lwal_1266 [Legionella waltersii]SNV12462.1 Uncharacterized conserved protein [Legionella waltersii]